MAAAILKRNTTSLIAPRAQHLLKPLYDLFQCLWIQCACLDPFFTCFENFCVQFSLFATPASLLRVCGLSDSLHSLPVAMVDRFYALSSRNCCNCLFSHVCDAPVTLQWPSLPLSCTRYSRYWTPFLHRRRVFMYKACPYFPPTTGNLARTLT